MGVQFIRLVPQLLNVPQLNATIEMEGSKDHSNAASGDGVSKHYGFQTRPTVNLSSRDDKKSYGDYETSDMSAHKGKDVKDARDTKDTKDTAKPAAREPAAKDQAKEPAKDQGKSGK